METLRESRYDTKYDDISTDDMGRGYFDCEECSYALGWCQVDTLQDASYYGTWANPYTFQIVNYCEGDITRTNCDNQAEFMIAMLDLKTWNDSAGWGCKVDPGLSQKMTEKWSSIGMNWFLYED